jgi:hypothetical protein
VKEFWNHHPELHAQTDKVTEKAKTEFEFDLLLVQEMEQEK